MEDEKRDRLTGLVMCGEGKKVLGRDLRAGDVELMGEEEINKLYEAELALVRRYPK